ncbi:MAG: hypothetical protein AAF698_01025, partial [Pseudomonadota bacterium]
RIFALAGTADALAGTSFAQYREAQHRLIEAFRTCDWPRAEAALDAVREALAVASDWRPETMALDQVVEIYAARIRALKAAPPAPDWDGVVGSDNEPEAPAAA